MSSPRRLILASASPRRVELLRAAGFAFDVDPADIDEDDVPATMSPENVAAHLARAKAMHVAARHPADVVVLGADTVVAIGNARFGKAETSAEASTMLRACGGRRQRVITGVAICSRGESTVDVATSEVEMRAMSDAELAAYVASDDWRGKAGAYGIQDQDSNGDPFVRLVSGTIENVVGLPIDRVIAMLARVGVVPQQIGAAR